MNWPPVKNFFVRPSHSLSLVSISYRSMDSGEKDRDKEREREGGNKQACKEGIGSVHSIITTLIKIAAGEDVNRQDRQQERERERERERGQR